MAHSSTGSNYTLPSSIEAPPTPPASPPHADSAAEGSHSLDKRKTRNTNLKLETGEFMPTGLGIGMDRSSSLGVAADAEDPEVRGRRSIYLPMEDKASDAGNSQWLFANGSNNAALPSPMPPMSPSAIHRK